MAISINTDKMVEFMVGLLNMPSPTGDTKRAMSYIQDSFTAFPFDMNLTPKGILVGTWTGQRHDAPRALTAHETLWSYGTAKLRVTAVSV